MTCPHCDRLAAQLAEAREEIAAWRANEADDARDDAALERRERWRRAFGREGVGAVLILMCLCDARGAMVRHERLFQATRNGFGAPDIEPSLKIVGVQMCKARSVLRALSHEGRLPRRFAAIDGGVHTHWGHGYSIAAEDARTLRQLAGEADQ